MKFRMRCIQSLGFATLVSALCACNPGEKGNGSDHLGTGVNNPYALPLLVAEGASVQYLMFDADPSISVVIDEEQHVATLTSPTGDIGTLSLVANQFPDTTNIRKELNDHYKFNSWTQIPADELWGGFDYIEIGTGTIRGTSFAAYAFLGFVAHTGIESQFIKYIIDGASHSIDPALLTVPGTFEIDIDAVPVAVSL